MSDADKKPTQTPGDGSSKSDRGRREISVERDRRERDRITTVMDTLKPPPNDRGTSDNGKTDKSRG